MSVESYQRGHLIEYDFNEKQWFYVDDNSPITVERPCKRCEMMPTQEGYDACLGYIPKVESACCGHGVTEAIRVDRSG